MTKLQAIKQAERDAKRDMRAAGLDIRTLRVVR